jgi:molybdopterin/thiamine biosynthesis adenylyltransferase
MHQPRLKRVYPPIKLAPTQLSLGMPGTPFSAVLDDPDGSFYRLASLLDGTRTRSEICAAVTDTLQPDDVDAFVEALHTEGYLEDATSPSSVQLTADEMARYDRNLEFFSFFSTPALDRYAAQAALKNSRVSVLGVGGLGSHIALQLTGLGVGHLKLIDFDVVENSNLNRQLLFTEFDLGKPKVDAAAAHLREANSLIEVETLNQRIEAPSDAYACFEDCDLLICAADRPRVELDRWLNQAALRTGQHWLRGSSVGLTAALVYYVPGRTGCVECQLSEVRSSQADDLMRQLTTMGEATITPCIAPVAGLLGSLAGLEAMKILTGLAPSPLEGRQLIVDLPNLAIEYVDNARSSTCPACGDAARRGGADD